MNEIQTLSEHNCCSKRVRGKLVYESAENESVLAGLGSLAPYRPTHQLIWGIP